MQFAEAVAEADKHLAAAEAVVCGYASSAMTDLIPWQVPDEIQRRSQMFSAVRDARTILSRLLPLSADDVKLTRSRQARRDAGDKLLNLLLRKLDANERRAKPRRRSTKKR